MIQIRAKMGRRGESMRKVMSLITMYAQTKKMVFSELFFNKEIWDETLFHQTLWLLVDAFAQIRFVVIQFRFW